MSQSSRSAHKTISPSTTPLARPRNTFIDPQTTPILKNYQSELTNTLDQLDQKSAPAQTQKPPKISTEKIIENAKLHHLERNILENAKELATTLPDLLRALSLAKQGEVLDTALNVINSAKIKNLATELFKNENNKQLIKETILETAIKISNYHKEISNEYFGTEFKIMSTAEESGKKEGKSSDIEIPDFFSNTENVEKLALFLESNKEKLAALGEDLPILYLGMKDIINGKIPSPDVVKKLSKVTSVQDILGEVRNFVWENQEFRDEILSTSKTTILTMLKGYSPGAGAEELKIIENEIQTLLGNSPELQQSYLDFAFLQFDTTGMFELLQGKKEAQAVVQDTLKIPFIQNLITNLSNSNAAPNIRNILVGRGVDVALDAAGEQIVNQQNWPALKAELTNLSQDPRLQEVFFEFLTAEGLGELTQTIALIQSEKAMEGAEQILQSPRAAKLFAVLRDFTQKTDTAETQLLRTGIGVISETIVGLNPNANAEQITEDLQKLLVVNQSMRESIMQLSLNPDKLRQIIALSREAEIGQIGQTLAKLKAIPEMAVILGSTTEFLNSTDGENLRNTGIEIATVQAKEAVKDSTFFQTPEGKMIFKEATAFVSRRPEIINTLLKLSTNPQGIQAIEKAFAPLLQGKEMPPGQILAKFDQLATRQPEVRDTLRTLEKDINNNPDIWRTGAKLAEVQLAAVVSRMPFFQSPEGKQVFEQAKPELAKLMETDVGLKAAITPLFFSSEGRRELQSMTQKSPSVTVLLKKINNSPHLQKAITVLRDRLINSPKLQEFTISAIFNKENLFDKNIRSFFNRHQDARTKIVDFALNTKAIERTVQTIQKAFEPNAKGGKPTPEEIWTKLSPLVNHPKVGEMLQTLRTDMRTNITQWRGVINFGLDKVTEHVGQISRILLKPFVEEGMIGQIDNAVAETAQFFRENKEIQASLADFLLNPKNINSLVAIGAAQEDPVKLLNLVAENTALVRIARATVKSLLARKDVQEVLSTVAVQYIDKLSAPTETSQTQSSTPESSAEPSTAPPTDPESLLDVIIANENLKGLIQDVTTHIASPEWKESRDKLFGKGTNATLEMVKTKFEISTEKWPSVQAELAQFMGINEEVQQSILSIASDPGMLKRALNFTKTKDYALLQDPRLQTIFNQVHQLFAQKPELLNNVTTTAVDIGLDKVAPEKSQKLRNRIKEFATEHVKPSVFEGKTLAGLIEDGLKAAELADWDLSKLSNLNNIMNKLDIGFWESVGLGLDWAWD